MSDKTSKCECFKCGGTGHIQAFSGIAGGVCFQCKGSGELTFERVQQARQELSAANRRRCDWILNATPETYANLNWSQINDARNFAHNYTMNRAAADLYGNSVWNAWRSQGGEQRFQELQETKRSDLNRFAL